MKDRHGTDCGVALVAHFAILLLARTFRKIAIETSNWLFDTALAQGRKSRGNATAARARACKLDHQTEIVNIAPAMERKSHARGMHTSSGTIVLSSSRMSLALVKFCKVKAVLETTHPKGYLACRT